MTIVPSKPMLCRDWIFDRDGTLTVPTHDFEDVRRVLGLPVGKPILEEIAELKKEKAFQILERLDRIVLRLAFAPPLEGNQA